jgi:hypothetical protein
MDKQRTKEQNETLVTKILDSLAKGLGMKAVSSQFNIPLGTIHSIMKRYRKKHGFHNNYHMLALYIIVQERKKYTKFTVPTPLGKTCR